MAVAVVRGSLSIDVFSSIYEFARYRGTGLGTGPFNFIRLTMYDIILVKVNLCKNFVM